MKPRPFNRFWEVDTIAYCPEVGTTYHNMQTELHEAIKDNSAATVDSTATIDGQTAGDLIAEPLQKSASEVNEIDLPPATYADLVESDDDGDQGRSELFTEGLVTTNNSAVRRFSLA